ncbi:MAG: IS110 family transposase [Chloroflexota bacterium]|jgi:transposase
MPRRQSKSTQIQPELVPSPVAFLGLDISQAEVVACLLLADGSEAVPRWKVSNDQPGAEKLAKRVAELAQRHHVQQLLIGMEATNLYWFHLACFLKDTEILSALDHQVYALNPKLVAGFKRSYPDLGKTDHLDAFFIAERLRLGRLPAPFQVDLLYAPIQRLTRFRTHLASSLAREKNYFLSFLFLKFSSFSHAQPFGDPFGATSSALLEEFTTEELAQAPLEELTPFINQHGRGRFADPESVATTLKRAARDSYRLDSVLDEPITLVLGTTMATIRALQRQLAELDKTIARELTAMPADRRTIISVPGLGPVWTAGLLAEIGDIHRFQNDAALAKFAGLVWNPSQSGSFQAEDTSMAKSGNAYLRYYLIEAANSVRHHCAEYRVYYTAKSAQSPKHAHKRALVLTARKLVRLVDHLLRTGSVYRPPESRQDMKEVNTQPHAAIPMPQRRSRMASSAL